jgi:hypothetical protein
MFGVTITFALGMRFFHLAFPIGLWLAGFPWLFVGTFLIMVFQFVMDNTLNPQEEKVTHSAQLEKVESQDGILVMVPGTPHNL